VAVKIKLKRLGKIREPYYRIVVADSRTKRDGRAIEEIGRYHPKAEPSLIEVNSERVQHWLSVGAQPTDPVRALLKVTGDWQKFTGEPGAEGTLRTAEPRVDKKERFAAVARQSKATKEDKASAQSKTGTGAKAASPPRDRTAKDGAAKDSAAKDGAAKDGAAKDGAARDRAGSASGSGGTEKSTRTRAAAKTAREPRGARAGHAAEATGSGTEAAASAVADATANAADEAKASAPAEATEATSTAEAADTAATDTAEATGTDTAEAADGVMAADATAGATDETEVAGEAADESESGA